MPTLTITPEDLEAFATIEPVKAQAMIDDALATAIMHAPCLAGEVTETVANAARAIIRGAILRWDDSGSGAYATQTAGPFSVGLDTRQARTGMFYKSEIDQLKNLCTGSGDGKAFSIDTVPCLPCGFHDEVCSAINYKGPYGPAYCTCGADIAGEPIYGVG